MMNKAFKYKIVTGAQSDVENEVEELTQQGWILHGGLLMGPPANGFSSTFAQTMIKEIRPRAAWEPTHPNWVR